MRKLIAIGGVPASGKTTIMREFLKGRNLEELQPRKLVTSMWDPDARLWILGSYNTKSDVKGFEGTDKLSMAVQPEAIKFLEECEDNIIFEGDRLFNQTFLDRAVDLVDAGELELQILVVQTDEKLVEERHIERKDTQSEQFKRGRETKIENICSSFILMPYITYMTNNTPEDLEKIVEWMRGHTK